ncbi:MAG: aminotransferase class I/II-fold pyridoxal phosphate-dependent enzyme [Eubacteriales bacterium]
MLDYAKILSENVQEIKPSGIRKFFDLLGDRKDVISLTVGEPDFMTPYHIREAGIESLEKGRTFYTSNNGILELRREICNYLNRRFGLTYEPKSEVIVTVGGSEAIDLTVRALIEPGDEAIIPVPSFVCYGPIVELAHGKPVFIETKEEDNFKLRPEALRAAITPKTKLLILLPEQPHRSRNDKDELKKSRKPEGTNIMVLSDEIYGELTYGRRHTAFATVGNMWERTITVSGFSKAYAMTGWRLGYLCAPKELVTQMHKIHQYAIMCAPTTSQLAAIEALKHGDPDIEMMANEYNRRRKYILDGLRKMGIDTFEAEGAFYVFPRIGKFGLSSDDFCQKLLDEKGVAIVPGNAFGDCGEGYARISYAYSVEHITEALKRMNEFIKELF